MKHLIPLLLAVAAIALLVGCGDDGAVVNEGDSDVASKAYVEIKDDVSELQAVRAFEGLEEDSRPSPGL